MLLLDIAGIFCLLQGIAPLVQKMAGQDPKQSFFIVNQYSDYQPLPSIALIVLGVLLIGTARVLRKSRK
ncbi:hypothetical protein AB0K51_33490 [Kitasatospora sp. NPDC049285]|uniref:hypothetical protein n=1 Tax=Kitasatospora sp. NPDC049285 TaxID=3157096 RepID=UPI00341FB5F0